MSATVTLPKQTHLNGALSATKSTDFLTAFIGDQIFGIPVMQVQDVLGEQAVTKIPLAPPEVAGSLNLRGRIVTAINVRRRLGLDKGAEKSHNMSVVVEHQGELYSFVIDRVGDVLTLQNNDFENTPATLDPVWKEISLGIFRLEKRLLVVIDVPKFISSIHG